MTNFNTKEEITLGKNYKLFLNKKLGNGAFGDLYRGENISTKKPIAIKCEKMKEDHLSLLKTEVTILSFLQGGIGIPKIYEFITSSRYNFMIFELLGLNLDELFRICKKQFSKETILSLGLQMLNRLEFIHSRHIIHRDIKPENFLIGKGKKNSLIYLCDFGLAKRFRDKRTGMHIPYKDGKKFTGTLTYASIYTHMGIEQSRRDDLESLAYILIYFCKGTLPWKSLKAKNRSEKQAKILSKKINTKNEELCSELPQEFSTFLQSIRDLHFEQKPDYDFLRGLLKKMNSKGVPLDQVKYDFINIFEKKKSSVINKNKMLLLENKEIKNNNNDLNANLSHKVTKSNTNNDSHNNKASINIDEK
jgi:serine/threonine protein kinase